MPADFDTTLRLALYREFVRTASPPTAETLAAQLQASAAEVRAAHAWYRNKMDSDWRRATVDETEALLAELELTGPFWSLRS